MKKGEGLQSFPLFTTTGAYDMRRLRLFLYLLLGLALGGWVTLSHAETIAATQGTVPAQTVYYVGSAPKGTTPLEAANNAFTWWSVPAGYTKLGVYSNSTCTQQNFVDGRAVYKKQQKDLDMSVSCTGEGTILKAQRCESGTLSGSNCVGAYSCPDTSWTLSGTTCTRADACPSSGTGTGTNEDKVSPAFPNLFGWYDPAATTTKGGSGTYCSSGCTVAFQATVCVQSTQPGTNNCAALNTTYTGATCEGTSAPIASGSTSKPPCAEGEGVVTMGGKVACVPMGVSSDSPKVSKGSNTQTFPDGSTKITNTTTTCSGVGACSTTTTTTITGATSGANAGGAGQAGTPGTTTDEEDEEGDETAFCAKNPDLQMCKGGIAEEATQKKVLDEVKKLTSVDSNTDKTAITNTSKYADTPGYQAAKDADDNLVKYASGVTKNGEVEAAKTTFEQALSSGFWTDIPSASCTTPTYVIAGHEIEWDRWCEIVGMIQQIGAYGMWVMLAISIFVMLSGGRQT